MGNQGSAVGISSDGEIPRAIFSTSSQVYPDNWQDIALAVKEMADWKCVRCGHPHDPSSGYTLTVHHLIPATEKINTWWNLPALCQRCHLAIQAKVVMGRQWMFEHSPWFKVYVAGYYAHVVLGVNLERAEVEDRLEELLKAGQPWLIEGEKA